MLFIKADEIPRMTIINHSPQMLSFLITLMRFCKGITRALKTSEFQVLFSLTVVTLLSGTIFYHFQEKWSWLDSLYFSVITLTTVGYGDFSPATGLAKVFTIIYIFIGLGILLGFINAISEQVIQEEKKKLNQKKRK